MNLPESVMNILIEAHALQITQAQLFAESGVDPSALPKWRKGTKPNTGTLEKLEKTITKYKKQRMKKLFNGNHRQ